MKSTSELTDFYYDALHDAIQSLEARREKLKKKIFTLFGVLGGVALIVIAVIYAGCRCFNEAYLWVAGAAGIIGAIAYHFMTRDYRSAFKEQIIRPLIGAIDSGLKYKPDAALSRSLFERARLFSGRIDRFRGNDLVRGTIDGIALEFSDVHAEQRHRDAKGREHWSTLFRGLFIVADFNKHLKGRTTVLPDVAENLFGSVIGGILQSRNFTKDDLVKLDDPAFEKAFVVYGTDQIEARYILTHSMMERLLGLKRETKSDIFVSFHGEKIMLAVDYKKDLFEPNLFRSLLSAEQALEYIKTLKSSIGVVEALKLNEKLWSKR